MQSMDEIYQTYARTVYKYLLFKHHDWIKTLCYLLAVV